MKPRERLRFWYGIFLSVFTIVVAALLIAEAADLYYGAAGGSVYSREIVSVRLARLAIPFWLWFAAAVAGYALSVLFPVLPARPSKDASAAYRRLRKNLPAGEGEAFLEKRKNLRRLEAVRFAVFTFAALFSAVAAVMGAVYLADVSNFPGADPSAEILGLVRNVAPWVGASFLLFVGATVYAHFSVKRETACMKELLVLGKGAPKEPPSAWAQRKEAAAKVLSDGRVKFALRAALGVVAVLFLVLGIVNGGARDVLFKAVNICKECIGLG